MDFRYPELTRFELYNDSVQAFIGEKKAWSGSPFDLPIPMESVHKLRLRALMSSADIVDMRTVKLVEY